LNEATQLRIYAATAFVLRRWEAHLSLSNVRLNLPRPPASAL